ncbi:MAG: carboxypeptidase-like regulatory domain-containing protein [Acidobacteriota bacterium]
MTRSLAVSVLGILALLNASSEELRAQSVPTGSFNVLVTRNGAPVGNATVCVGVSADLNQFFQGQTNAQGRLAFASVPADPFIITANSEGRGTQRSFSPAATSFFTTEIALPASGGPACPITPAGSSRTLVPQDLKLPVATATPFTAITLTHTEFCFGALGAGCGQPQFPIPPTALCANGACFINGGSWDHDQCCFAHPHGMACQRGPLDGITGHDGHCVTEWNKALRLVGKGLMWKRNINFQTGNTTGTVAFNLYCAPANTLVNPEDTVKCCSRIVRALTLAENAAAAAASETLRACR